MCREFTFSIITVTYNAEDTIEATIESLVRQDHNNYEIILVDGQSTDRTVNLAQSILDEHGVSYHIHIGNDLGIFDAMNKGVVASNGKWLIFINSGDQLYSTDTLSVIAPNLSRDCGYYYGGVSIRYSGSEFFDSYPRKKPNFSFGMGFCHQGMVISAELLKKQPYSTEYKLAADYCFVLWCNSNNINFKYIPMLIATVTSGGISDYQREMVINEWVACLNQYNKYYYANAIYFFNYRMYIRAIALIKKLLGETHLQMFLRLKNRLTK